MGLHYLAEMNTDQVKALQKKTKLAFLPIGPTEVHGRHLPMMTDSVCAQETAAETAAKLQERGVEVLIAPTINHCLADLANEEVGNITLRFATVANLIEDIAVGLAKWGFTRILVVCGHGEPRNMQAIAEGLHQAETRCADLKTAISDWFPKSVPMLDRVCKEEHPEWDLHAGEAETAQIMYLFPDLVDHEVLKTLEPNWNGEHLFANIAAGKATMAACGAPLTYFGDPRIATAETGKKVFELYAEIVVEEALELLNR